MLQSEISKKNHTTSSCYCLFIKAGDIHSVTASIANSGVSSVRVITQKTSFAGERRLSPAKDGERRFAPAKHVDRGTIPHEYVVFARLVFLPKRRLSPAKDGERRLSPAKDVFRPRKTLKEARFRTNTSFLHG